MQFADDDPSTEARIKAVERFTAEHERRHAALVKQLVRIAGEANGAFQIAMRPQQLNGFGGFGNMLTDSIRAIHVRSEYGPDIDLVDPFGPAEPNPLMAALKPQIVLDTSLGPVTVNPYGTPGPTKWNSLLQTGGLVGIVLFGLASYGAWRLIRG